MKKVLELLERHVQWIAVGIGALFVLWVAWTFLIGSPVKVQVNNENLGPGDVDRYIVDHPVAELSGQMNNPNVPKFPVPNWKEQFVATMEMKNINPVALAGLWVTGMPVQQIITPTGAPTPVGPGFEKLDKLPTLVAAEMGEILAGASNVDKNQLANAGGQPGQPNNNGGANPAPAQPVANGGVDLNWASAPFKISNKAMSDAFTAAKIPNALSTTCFLTVHLQRQEMQQDGTWGPEVDVKTPGTVVLQPTPADSAPNPEKQAYLQWAAGHQPDILQPPFWPVLVGDKWAPPNPDGPTTKPADVAAQGLPDFDPNKWDYTPEDVKKMTPQQRAQFFKAKEKHEADERKARAGDRAGRGSGRPGGGKGGGAVGGGGPRGPNDGNRPPGPPYPGPYPYPRPPMAEGEPEAPQQQTTYPCPQGMFNPTTVTQTPVQPGQALPQGSIPEYWVGWAHDDSVEPGRTYRYRVTYSIRSPAFGYAIYCNPPKLAESMALTSPASAWSKEVRIPLRTSFYVASNPSGNGMVRFDVYTWQGGVKRGKTFELQPGDLIGGTDAGINFNTGWTIVDIGTDVVHDNKKYVLIADPKGNLVKRDYFTDQNNPDYKNDKAAAANANAAASTGQ